MTEARQNPSILLRPAWGLCRARGQPQTQTNWVDILPNGGCPRAWLCHMQALPLLMAGCFAKGKRSPAPPMHSSFLLSVQPTVPVTDLPLSNLPDMRGRVAVGSDANSPGTMAGEKTHIQTANEMPNHGHGIRANPPLNLEVQNIYAGKYLRAALLKANAWGAAADIYNNYADATGVITSGGSAAMNLMQPSLYLHHIIKI